MQRYFSLSKLSSLSLAAYFLRSVASLAWEGRSFLTRHALKLESSIRGLSLFRDTAAHSRHNFRNVLGVDTISKFLPAIQVSRSPSLKIGEGRIRNPLGIPLGRR